ncbi:unnamed protein product [Cunninghamella blakesleeana]
MLSKPMMYNCCLPRPGIMAICFIHGCVGYLSFILLLISYQINSAINDPELKRYKGYYRTFEFTRALLFLAISTVYFYASYLSYKKRVLFIKPLMKVFKSSILLGIVLALYEFYMLIQFSKDIETVYEDEAKKVPNNQIKFIVVISYTIFYILFLILPLLNEIYVFRKLGQYIEYIEVKKNDIKHDI